MPRRRPRRVARPVPRVLRPRPSAALAEQICQRLAAGQALDALCADPAMPSGTGLRRWRAADAAFDARIRALLQRPRPSPRRGLTDYSPARAQAVLARLAAGESQRSIARDPDMPCVMTLLRWTREVPGFAEARARALQAPRRYPPRRYAATSPERLDRLCLRLLDGPPLSLACLAPDVPSEGSIRRHARRDPAFRRAFEIARMLGEQMAAERMRERFDRLDLQDPESEEVDAFRRTLRAARRRAGKRAWD